MDRLEEMRAFARIVDAGTISGAADQLNLAKSAVSRRLSELEKRLGVQLVRRTTRRLSLTDSGRSFYARCVQILADIDEAENEVTAADMALTGRLRVAAPLSFGIRHLGPAINEFIQQNPELDFELDFNDRPVDLIEEGYDLAIRIAELRDSSLIARRLTRIRRIVVASPAYWRQHGFPDTPEALAAHAGLHYLNTPRLGWSCTAPDGSAGQVRLKTRLQANNGDFLSEAAMAGLGIALQPTFIVYRDIEAGRLQPVLTEYSWSDLDAWAVYPAARRPAKRVQALVDFLADRYAGTPYWDKCLT
jgi:DNA-binding transcriptional LysR family regulator